MTTSRPDASAAIPMPENLRAHALSDDLVWLSFDRAPAVAPHGLTAAELEVALLVYEDQSNQAIAEARGVSVKTVGNQLESIYRKLGVQSRVELVLAMRGGGGR